ncbi:MAG: ATP-binding protein, partial [Nitrospirae bacterium]|nr:ATP-binding protein [Nitrospirota bacterium]
MLVSFKVSNFLSILDEQELCLYPSRVRLHKDHVYKSKNPKLPQVLKSSLLYGANSSGKSNMVKAIAFSKKLICTSQKNDILDVPIFKLLKYQKIETKFTYEIILKDTCYLYSFIIEHGLIKEECLKIISNNNEKLIFERITNDEKVIVKFNIKFEKSEEFHKIISKGTKTSQLFINYINEQNAGEIEEVFKDIYHWFKNKFTIISPDGTAKSFEIKIIDDKVLKDFYEKYLNLLDTGIDKLEFVEISFDDPKFMIPDIHKQEIEQEVINKNEGVIVNISKYDTYYIQKQSNDLRVRKIKASHKLNDNNAYIQFDFNEESDGTNRILNLIPMLYMLEQGHTVIIDEIDRSFHTLISEKIFELFFKNTSNIQSQLIATT